MTTTVLPTVMTKKRETVLDGMRIVDINVCLRPLDEGWVMGEDLEVIVSENITIRELMILIEDRKGMIS